jgi:hypothetical protein
MDKEAREKAERAFFTRVPQAENGRPLRVSDISHDPRQRAQIEATAQVLAPWGDSLARVGDLLASQNAMLHEIMAILKEGLLGRVDPNPVSPDIADVALGRSRQKKQEDEAGP